jgi:2-isopropylmalate synthase
MNKSSQEKIIIFDTTMRDGELTPGVKMNLEEKLELAKLLETMKVNVIEVGYPGFYQKDFAEIATISKEIKDSIICGLASSQKKEIEILGEALKKSNRGRINIYTNVNNQSKVKDQETREIIKESIKLASNYCDDVQWCAFGASNKDLDFLCQTIEIAIKSGATTISIPDTFGLFTPEEFTNLITPIVQLVSSHNKTIIAVHCHNDLGLAVANSIAALKVGARQVECSLNGLGARKGNADLAKVIKSILEETNYQLDLDLNLISKACDLVTQITKRASGAGGKAERSES